MDYLTIFSAAIKDIKNGLASRHIWMALAKEDIDDQHRRTRLGPVWMLLNYLLLAGAFIALFGFDSQMKNHASYVAIGLFVWFYCSEVISRSVTLFQREENFITGTPLPISVYVLRLSMQSLIRAGYTAVGCVAIVMLSGVDFSWQILWSLAGILLILAITPAVVILFAIAGTWFSDLQFIVSNMLRLGLFLTPIFWTTSSGAKLRDVIYVYNPFTWVLEMVRAPVLGGEFPAFAFGFCIILGGLSWVMALYFLGLLRKKIVFML